MNGQWQQISVEATVPAGVDKTHISISVDGVGSVWLDDVAFTAASGQALPTLWPGAGARTFRTWDTVTWSVIEPTKGRFNWDVLDAVVATAGRRQGDVILTLGQTPPWASPFPDVPIYYGLGASYPPVRTPAGRIS